MENTALCSVPLSGICLSALGNLTCIYIPHTKYYLFIQLGHTQI